jgi:NADPH-dependent 2,4-dienoyl-CoA reductase/sulfur reductase-like enzyme
VELQLPIPGLDGPNVVPVILAHLQRERVRGESLVVCGGGLSGCDFALEAAMAGKKVTVVEALDKVARDVFAVNAISLHTLLQKHGVTLLTGHKVTAVDAEGVHCAFNDEQVLVPADTVITAFGVRPNRQAAEAIQSCYPEKTVLIGDCLTPKKAGDAVRGGFFASWSLD